MHNNYEVWMNEWMNGLFISLAKKYYYKTRGGIVRQYSSLKKRVNNAPEWPMELLCQIWKLFKWNIQFSPFKVWLDPVIPELEVVTSEVIFPVPKFSSPKEIVKLFLHQYIAIGHAFRSMFPKVSKVKMIIQCEHLKIFIPKLNGGSVKLSLCTFWEMWHVEAMSVPQDIGAW